MSTLGRAAKHLGTGAGTAITFGLTCYAIAEIFFDLEVIKKLGHLGFAFFLLASVSIGALYALLQLAKTSQEQEESKDPSARKLSEELEKIVRRIHDSGHPVDVVRFGSQLSRPLWLGGRYKERIAIAEMVEESAALVQMHDERVEALIDGLGWTYVITGDLQKAEENIEQGVALAIKIEDYYSAAKGERHLSGIYDRKNDPVSAESHLVRALQFTEKIEDGYCRDEMRAGILFARAELLLVKADYNATLAMLEESRRLYEKIRGQEERLVKIQSRLGRVYLGMKIWTKARDAFRAGLAEAKRLLRIDEIALNLLGLGEVYLSRGSHDKAQKALVEAITLFEELGMKGEIKKAKHLLVEAERQN